MDDNFEFDFSFKIVDKLRQILANQRIIPKKNLIGDFVIGGKNIRFSPIYKSFKSENEQIVNYLLTIRTCLLLMKEKDIRFINL